MTSVWLDKCIVRINPHIARNTFISATICHCAERMWSKYSKQVEQNKDADIYLLSWFKHMFYKYLYSQTCKYQYLKRVVSNLKMPVLICPVKIV